MAPRYEPRPLEAKWQKIWEERGLFNAPEDPARPKYYVLEMFPDPSGASTWATCATIPLGTWWPGTSGCRVLTCSIPWAGTPSGCPWRMPPWPGGLHPAAWTYDNIEYMRRQLKELGYSYDWRRAAT